MHFFSENIYPFAVNALEYFSFISLLGLSFCKLLYLSWSVSHPFE